MALLVLSPHALASSVWESRPVRIIQTTDADFPTILSNQGVTEGEVRAVLNIDAEGRYVDCLVTGYSHRELAVELLRRVRDWRYEPAISRGEPVNVRFEVVFGFKSKGSVVSFTPIEAISSTVFRMVKTNLTSVLCKPGELDQPLVAVHVVQPAHPGRALQPAQPTGRAVLDFYIDVEGRPRIPVVSRSTHDAFAIAAVAALEQWRFNPPQRDGKPVMVRVVQEFVFSDRS